MSNTISLRDWLQKIDEEYLSSFVSEGGSSVKFAVTPGELKPALDQSMSGLCEKLGYAFVKLDGTSLRVHMPQDIFFGLAGQVDWRVLARRVILRLAREKGYTVDDVDVRVSRNVFAAIADANAIESRFFLREIRPGIQNHVFKDLRMAKDFRVAMMHLCLSEDTRDGGEYDGQPVLDWLTEARTRVSSVRPFDIYSRIDRTTARYFIQSALHWVRFAGCTGTVVLLDNSRVTVARNPRDGRRYYTKAMTMDHYELLREFIDDIDRLSGTLLVVVTNSDFLDEGSSSRGYAIYQALRTRVMDDVRDKKLVNPVASLVRLS